MTKIAIIVASEKLDKLFPAVTLATTGALSGWEAELFFTFWGLLALRKGYESSGVSGDYQMYEEKLKEAISSGARPDWKAVLEQGRKTGRIHIHACSATLGLFGMKPEDLESFVDDIAGASTFLSRAKNAEVSFFIS
jgi:peroxiredoxin family protein